MDVQVVTEAIQAREDELIVVNLFEGVDKPNGATGDVDQAISGTIREAIADGDFRGKKGEVAVFYPRGAIPAGRVVLVGLGPEEKFGLQAVREAAASAAKKARELGVLSFSSVVHGAGAGGLAPEAAAQAAVEGTILGLYRYRELKNEDPDRPDPEMFTLVEYDPDQAEA
ncbi:MAG: M17 family peptidase N-terminal domain-containing protein, partial [Anaerolineae bacterium]